MAAFNLCSGIFLTAYLVMKFNLQYQKYWQLLWSLNPVSRIALMDIYLYYLKNYLRWSLNHYSSSVDKLEKGSLIAVFYYFLFFLDFKLTSKALTCASCSSISFSNFLIIWIFLHCCQRHRFRAIVRRRQGGSWRVSSFLSYSSVVNVFTRRSLIDINTIDIPSVCYPTKHMVHWKQQLEGHLWTPRGKILKSNPHSLGATPFDRSTGNFTQRFNLRGRIASKGTRCAITQQRFQSAHGRNKRRGVFVFLV